MFRNFLTIAWRGFFRDRSFSIINLLGLALGIVAFVFIIRYASFEMSYDRFHADGENIYRVSRHEYGDLPEASARAFYAIGPEAFASFPEVVNYTRMHPADGIIAYQDEAGNVKSFFEDRSYYADTSFFTIFSFPLVQGDLKTVLQNPASVAISESAAQKYFGEADPIGKVLSLTTADWQDGDYVVSGVFRDVPTNSHLSFDFIFPIQGLLNNFQFDGQGWRWTNFYNYLLVKPDADIAWLQQKLSAFPEKYLSALLSCHQIRMEFHLQAVPDINLYSELAGEVKETGKWGKLKLLITAAFFIMGLAWLNYINLTTARATRRSREVGLRKVMGSDRQTLIRQFVLESLLLNGVAIGLAIIILLVVTPPLDQLVSEPLSFDWSEQYGYWLLFVIILAGGTGLSGLYPAIYLSALRPIQALRGEVPYQGKNYLRQTFVVVQFAISFTLMVGTIIIHRQVGLLQQQDLGMDITQKLVVRAPGTPQNGFWSELNTFKSEVTKQARIENATVSYEVPGHDLGWGQEVDVAGGRQNVTLQWTSFDHDFVPVYGIDVIAGRNFSGKFEGPVILINETAVRALGFANPEEAIDQEFTGSYPRRIIGVISDYYQRSPKFKVAPLAISPFSKEKGYITLTVQQQDLPETLTYVEALYQTLFPANAFEYFFLDEYFAQQFASDQQFSQVVAIFSGVALFIAGLGLFGFTSYLSHTRAREVGIRKVLGAARIDIFWLFNQSIVKLVVIAGLLSSPMIYWAAQAWLTNYATRVELTVPHFILPILVLLVVSVIITTLQLTKLMRTSTVDLL